MKLKMIYVLVLFLISFSVLADTYTAIPTYSVSGQFGGTPTLACKAWGDYTWPSNSYTWAVSGTQCVRNGNNVSAWVVTSSACPGGGTVSGTSCINAPACIAPLVRSLTTGMCVTPECAPPKFLNQFGVCGIPECETYKVPNESTGVCQVPPVCGSTEYYDNPTNTCKLSSLNCPGHSHASVTNDSCLPDSPLACPAGQHDDGTYTCVADDGKTCKKGEQPGLINGVKNCIAHPNLDTKSQEAADRAAAQAANDASNADPTNIGLANQANNVSNQGLVNGVGTGNDIMRSINDNVTEANDREKSKQATTGGDSCNEPPACSGDPIQCAILKETHKNHCRSTPDPKMTDDESNGSGAKIDGLFSSGMPSDMGTSAFNGMQPVSTAFFNLGGSSCQAMPMAFKGFTFNFDPCVKFAIFRNLLGWFFYMWTAISIVQLGREKS